MIQKPILTNVKKLTDNKYINMYKLTYTLGAKTITYCVTSRREISVDNLDKHKVDAVIVLPYVKNGNDISVVFIRQFRFAVNDYIYDVPAGCVDGDEDTFTTAKRELLEEIGASTLDLTPCTDLSFISPGCLNEASQTFFAQVKLDHKQNLEGDEIIEPVIVPLNELPKFLEAHTMAVQGKMLAMLFYCKVRLQNQKDTKRT